MNRKIFLTALWICALLVGIVSPAPAQSLADIAAVTPWEGTMGTQATITGTGFGEKQRRGFAGDGEMQAVGLERYGDHLPGG